jgi:hypothetical protein
LVAGGAGPPKIELVGPERDFAGAKIFVVGAAFLETTTTLVPAGLVPTEAGGPRGAVVVVVLGLELTVAEGGKLDGKGGCDETEETGGPPKIEVFVSLLLLK